jgi:hypothetical protein
MNKGILYNLKMLTLNPREIIEKYLKGKRVDIFNPISYLIVASTIYVLLESTKFSFFDFEFFDAPEKLGNSELYSQGHSFGEKIGDFIKYSFKYFWVLSAVWLSWANRLVFDRCNLAEHLTISSFIIGHTTLYMGIWQVLFGNPILFNPLTYLLIIWMNYRVFKKGGKEMVAFQNSMFSMLVFIIILLVVILLIGIGLQLHKYYFG